MRVLVVNAGSSSLKLTLLGADDQVIAARELDAGGAGVNRSALSEALSAGLDQADAIGHRIVHGGDRFLTATILDSDVEASLRELIDLAPLHQGKSLAAFDAVSAALPDTAAVACFDTAFHATLPAAAATYALPAAWRERWPIRRYGFHGLSHAWVARRAPLILDRDPSDLRLVSCHLGAGGSLCAIHNGCSVDTTMGFTPLEGLVMATRSGNVDPGLILWLIQHADISPAEISSALEQEAGMKGLAGTADMRIVLARANDGDESSMLALEVWLHRLRGLIAGMAASMGGLDALIFTGGIGERSPPLRARALDRLGFLGLSIDPDLNEASRGDLEITSAGARTRTLVIEPREDLEIARQTRGALVMQQAQ